MAYTLLKMDEHAWKIEYTLPDTITDVHLLDYEQNFIEAFSFASTYINIDLTEYGDGSYIVKIIRDSGLIDYLPIHDISSAQLCYLALFRYILCSCDDPCNDCDDGIKARVYDMNSIMSLVDSVKEMVFLEIYQFFGVYSLTDKREDMIEQIGLMIEKLNIITDRCGLCSETESNSITC